MSPAELELGGHVPRTRAAGAARAPSPSRAELRHDGCARRRGEPKVEQLPGNRLLVAAHTQTFVTISRTFYSSSFLAGARPGTQVRSCSQRHRHPQPLARGPRWGRGRQMQERQDRPEAEAGETLLCGRPRHGLGKS